MKKLTISFGQLVEAAPARVRGRHGILGQPLAAGEVVEVLARLAGLVQNREFNAVRGGTGGFRAARLLPGAEDSHGTTSEEKKNGYDRNLPKPRSFLRAETSE